jgi:hypothetical protein
MVAVGADADLADLAAHFPLISTPAGVHPRVRSYQRQISGAATFPSSTMI